MKTNRALFLASFFTLIAAGMGFAVRGAVLGDWAEQFGFTKTDLGVITGGGLVGFGVTIIAFSLVADQIGYKPLMMLAFALHAGSAVLLATGTPIYHAYGQDATYWWLYAGNFMFALANGVCEAVINPLVATLYPRQKTHYLNILHAGWPGGLIVGGLLGWCFVGQNATLMRITIGGRGFWEVPMCFFLAPVLFYGFVMIKEHFPHSEAKAAGVTFLEMLKHFAVPVFLMLLVLHAMVGYVELGTDSWITDIMNQVLSGNAILVLVYTSSIMFVLRFFAGPIVERINPVGLLFCSAVIACIGLYWLGSVGATATASMVFVAATVYGLGKTFFWPTMLGVVGERFPRGGAITMGTVGGVGMLSAGLLGGPGIGYTQDYFASQQLKGDAPAVYEQFQATAPYSTALQDFVSPAEQRNGQWPAKYGEVIQKERPNAFLWFPRIVGLDGTKVGALKEKKYEGQTLATDEKQVLNADLYGAMTALKVTAAVPFAMAVGYLILLIYFRMKGGYKVEVLHGRKPEPDEYTGGVEGPVL